MFYLAHELLSHMLRFTIFSACKQPHFSSQHGDKQAPVTDTDMSPHAKSTTCLHHFHEILGYLSHEQLCPKKQPLAGLWTLVTSSCSFFSSSQDTFMKNLCTSHRSSSTSYCLTRSLIPVTMWWTQLKYEYPAIICPLKHTDLTLQAFKINTISTVCEKHCQCHQEPSQHVSRAPGAGCLKHTQISQQQATNLRKAVIWKPHLPE